eukprot:m.14285 g.14285  ORF g.14285 m.14285 type:complete len:332 (-) comp5055_c0_seq1:137-1132(-)
MFAKICACICMLSVVAGKSVTTTSTMETELVTVVQVTGVILGVNCSDLDTTSLSDDFAAFLETDFTATVGSSTSSCEATGTENGGVYLSLEATIGDGDDGAAIAEALNDDPFTADVTFLLENGTVDGQVTFSVSTSQTVQDSDFQGRLQGGLLDPLVDACAELREALANENETAREAASAKSSKSDNDDRRVRRKKAKDPLEECEQQNRNAFDIVFSNAVIIDLSTGLIINGGGKSGKGKSSKNKKSKSTKGKGKKSKKAKSASLLAAFKKATTASVVGPLAIALVSSVLVVLAVKTNKKEKLFINYKYDAITDTLTETGATEKTPLVQTI